MKHQRNRLPKKQLSISAKFGSLRSFSYNALEWIASNFSISSYAAFSQAEQPPSDGTSPISTLPLEILSHLLSFVPLNENLPLRSINREWQDVWNIEITRQMNPIRFSLEIQSDLSRQERVDILWKSQSNEIDYLLSNEELVLEKTNNDQSIILTYEKLKRAAELRRNSFALSAREKVLNRINEVIINQRIRQSKVKGNKKLDCEDCSLTRFPAIIIEKEKKFWQELLWCTFENNHITALPENISLGTSLVWLSFSRNHLIKLPESMGQCLQLQGLQVSNNHLITLPESISHCVALQGLFANNNYLQALPNDIGRWKALQVLAVYDNELDTLPESIDQCMSLQWICVDNNQLTQLPANLGRCKALRSFSALNNHITTLPESLGECLALEWLHVNNNCLASIPENIAKSQKLKQFSEGQVLASQKAFPVSNDDDLQEVGRSIKKLKLQ